MAFIQMRYKQFVFVLEVCNALFFFVNHNNVCWSWNLLCAVILFLCNVTFFFTSLCEWQLYVYATV